MKSYDLIIVGAGSGNMLPEQGFGSWKVAIVESDRMGGTCLNRGCIPSKCFVYTADVAQHIHHASTFNIDADLVGVDWPAIRDRVFARIDPLHQSAVDFRRENGIDVYTDVAKFVDNKVIQVGNEQIRGERIVIASGSRPFVPPIPGIQGVPHQTSDTIMRLPNLPKSMVILGGGYIAAEMAHIFSSLGVQITIVNRSDQLLVGQDRDTAKAFTDVATHRWDVRLGSIGTKVANAGAGIELTIERSGQSEVVEAEMLLVATGRMANTDTLDVRAAGVDCDSHGHVITDEFGRTNVEGIWALGDVSNHFQLKHVANAEARAVFHNITNAEHMRKPSLGVVPAIVFTSPQIAAVGETEQQLIERSARYVSTIKYFSDTAYGWAMEDTTSFAKVLMDTDTGLALGAHIIGPQASLLLQPLVQAMALQTPLKDIAQRVMYPHPALSEVIEQALLEI